MLTIRMEQVEALSAGHRAKFEERMALQIAEEYPKRFQVLGEDGTKKLVRSGIDIGAKHGLDTEGAVGVLIEVIVEFGERFERSPDAAWAREMLEHPTLPGVLKARLIRDRLTTRTGGRMVVPVSTAR